VQRELADQIARPLAWPRRFTVVAGFFLATVLCYVDRVSISIAIIPLSRDRGYDGAAQGIILSAFFWGYLWPQLLGGWMSDRFGGRRVLAAGVAVWSLATLLTPPASAAFSLLIAMRVLLGLGEGVNFPAIHSITARWTLAEERSRVIALNFSGIHLGTVIALLVSPAIIVTLGWHALFYISGAIGLVWVCVWLWKTSETPETDPEISREELATIIAGRPEAPPALEIPWRTILHEKAVMGHRHRASLHQLRILHPAAMAPDLSRQNLPDDAAEGRLVFVDTVDRDVHRQQPRRMDRGPDAARGRPRRHRAQDFSEHRIHRRRDAVIVVAVCLHAGAGHLAGDHVGRVQRTRNRRVCREPSRYRAALRGHPDGNF